MAKKQLSAKERLANLIDVKTIITLAIVGAFVVMTIFGRELDGTFLSVVTLVLGFYFGKGKDTKFDGENATEAKTDGNPSE